MAVEKRAVFQNLRDPLRNLGYNILKSLEDKTVRDINFPELGSCPECGNDILKSPLNCIENKLFLGTPSTCPAPGCGKNANPLNQVESHLYPSQWAKHLPYLTDGGIEGTTTQQVKSTLSCAKCYKDLSSCLPPLCPICPSTDMEIDDTETPAEPKELLTDIPVVGGISEESSCATDARALFNRYKELKPTYGKEGVIALVKNEVRKEISET
ncbi:hypothetical protein C1645_834378 [Glomus cerebriforme]|uniref:Uncharacterized protein n=1 Tax=Glomus cerebriforme TaxID=658196 RepID=A0A397SAP4_9GLOM|nr:hypothetical protein C1645_834378 [Glomus cerebriforme]